MARAPVRRLGERARRHRQRAGNGNSSTLTYNSAAPRPASTIASIRASWSASPSATPAARSGSTASSARAGPTRSTSRPTARFTPGGFYADALAGYAYSNNQLQRQILIPGLQPRTANGRPAPTSSSARSRPATRSASSRRPATTSRRSPACSLERQPERASPNGAPTRSTSTWRSRPPTRCARPRRRPRRRHRARRRGKLDLALRLGWLHEFADTGRPITAAFAGAPASGFTVYGATPQRDRAVIGFSASTAVADATQLYLAMTANSAAAPTTMSSTSACG